MFNLLLDALPTEYEGYLIRTDYRIGIQISQALEDEELEPYERIGIALSLLYGNGIPPADIAAKRRCCAASSGAARHCTVRRCR